MFALQNSGNVHALNSDGTVGWIAPVGSGDTLLPDFQGGLVVANGSTVKKLDGMTGQASPAYSYSNTNNGASPVLVHTDGTIFTVDNNAIVGINPTTGQPKFTPIPLQQTVTSGNGNCGEYTPYESSWPATVGQPIIAGDGYAYFPYVYWLQPLASNQAICSGGGGSVSHIEVYARVMRVGTDGSAVEIAVHDWVADGGGGASTGTVPLFNTVTGTLITNADQGVLYSWGVCLPSGPSCTAQFQLTSIDESGTASSVPTNLGYQDGTNVYPVQPMLQRQDGTFVGRIPEPSLGSMVVFDRYGNQKWSQPGYTPQIATSDNGVIATSSSGQTTTFDANGNQIGQLASLPTQSWTRNTYKTLGSVDQVAALEIDVAGASFSPQSGSNPSKNVTALQECAPLDSTTSAKLEEAYSALVAFLLNTYCAYCNASIFQPLSTSQAEFTAYLQQGHRFCDGTKSSEPGGLIGVNYRTVADYFKLEQQPPDSVSAATALDGGRRTFTAWGGILVFASDARKTAKTFFSPMNVAPKTLQFNESMLFHEALHGFSGLRDGGLIPGLCEILGATPQTKISALYPNCWSESDDITHWIEDNIISPLH